MDAWNPILARNLDGTDEEPSKTSFLLRLVVGAGLLYAAVLIVFSLDARADVLPTWRFVIAEEPEYFRAKEAQEPVNSLTSRFQGNGGSKGATFGLASEFPLGPLHVGPEAGVAVLYSRWKAYFANKEEEVYGCGVGWSCADGWHSTLYIGATARYEWLFVSYRRYLNVHASQASKNPLFIGPTTGPVDQVLIGVSIPL